MSFSSNELVELASEFYGVSYPNIELLENFTKDIRCTEALFKSRFLGQCSTKNLVFADKRIRHPSTLQPVCDLSARERLFLIRSKALHALIKQAIEIVNV